MPTLHFPPFPPSTSRKKKGKPTSTVNIGQSHFRGQVGLLPLILLDLLNARSDFATYQNLRVLNTASCEVFTEQLYYVVNCMIFMSAQYVNSKETKTREKEEKFGAIGRWRILHQIKKMLTFPKIPTLVQTHVDLTLRSAMQVVQIRRGNMCLNLLGAFLGRGMPSCPVHLFCLALNIFVVSNDFLPVLPDLAQLRENGASGTSSRAF